MVFRIQKAEIKKIIWSTTHLVGIQIHTNIMHANSQLNHLWIVIIISDVLFKGKPRWSIGRLELELFCSRWIQLRRRSSSTPAHLAPCRWLPWYIGRTRIASLCASSQMVLLQPQYLWLLPSLLLLEEWPPCNFSVSWHTPRGPSHAEPTET